VEKTAASDDDDVRKQPAAPVNLWNSLSALLSPRKQHTTNCFSSKYLIIVL